MIDNIYVMKNKCPKCGTVINDPYTENLRCICTKHNCKYEFKKELQGIIGVTLKRGTENYQGKNGDCDFILTDEETGLNSTYTNYKQLQRDLDIFQDQEKLKGGRNE